MDVLMTLQGAQMEDDDPTISYMLQVYTQYTLEHVLHTGFGFYGCKTAVSVFVVSNRGFSVASC